MRLVREIYEEPSVIDDSIGDIKTKIFSINFIDDLKELNLIRDFNDLGLLIGRDWTPEGKELYKSILSKEIKFPFFNNYKSYRIRSNFYFYELEPIDNFSYYIEIGVEDLLNNQDLFDYVIYLLPILYNRTNWEGDLRNGFYMCITPGYEGIPILIAKQDNDGTTFLASQFRVGWLEPENCPIYVEGASI